MRRAGIISLYDFSGGEASKFPITAMPPKYSLLLQNFHVNERGSIAKIPGYERVNSISCGVALSSGFEFKRADGVSMILAAGEGRIFRLSAGNLTEIRSGLNTGAKVYFAAMNNICIMCNGVDAPLRYDGTTVSALGGTPPATSFKPHVHRGRVWMLERTNKMLATHSSLSNPEDYTSAGNAGFIDFRHVLRKGDELLDIFTYVNMLVFLFRNHIAIYSGATPSGSNSDFRMEQLIEGAGVVATDTLQGLGTDCAFLYDSGVKSLRQVIATGSLNLHDLSEFINAILIKETKTAGIFSSAHYPKLGWYLIKIGATVFIYSYIQKAWSRMVGADVNGMFTTTDGKLYLCGNGFLYEYDRGWTFAGTNPISKWNHAWINLAKAGNKVYPKTLEIAVQPHAETIMDFSYSYDLSLSTRLYHKDIPIKPRIITYMDGVLDFDAINPFDEIPFDYFRIPLFGGGKVMQMNFINTSNQPVEINNILLQVVSGGF